MNTRIFLKVQMTIPTSYRRLDLVRLSSEVISAYVIYNEVTPARLLELIPTIHCAFDSLGQPAPAVAEVPAKPSASEIKRSIAPDGLRSFIDGKTYKALKRHLGRHAMTPAEYRTRFGLPGDYPMVASAYAAKRSEMAKAAGLGQGRRARDAGTVQAATTLTQTSFVPSALPAVPRRRGRPKRAPGSHASA